MKRMSLFLWVVFLFLQSPREARGEASCWCWIGIERGDKLIDYGAVAKYRDLESGKKRKCSQACSRRCAKDLGNAQLLCSKIGGDYSDRGKLGCFSVVGARDSLNNTWDYDGRPTNFPGCSKCCTCPEGWFDKNRNSCVTGTNCKVPGMPNGDKGGGYFAWDQNLFLNLPGADCEVVPGSCPAPRKGVWTAWLNRDGPGGSGDFETLKDLRSQGVCAKPLGIECRVRGDHRPWNATGQTYTCAADKGGICQNKGQSCLDYEVRFLCPK